MSEELEALRRRLHTAGELKSVVRTMKTLAAVSIVPYEKAVHSLAHYYRAVELGLIACLRNVDNPPGNSKRGAEKERTGVVVFGSDQGMVGQFNETLADFVLGELEPLSGTKQIWPVGERIAWRLKAPNVDLMPLQSVPDTVAAVTSLTATILEGIQQHHENRNVTRVLVFHNQPFGGRGYQPVRQQLLPFDTEWLRALGAGKWPTKMIPQVMPVETETLAALLREYLFVSLFRACAESLASESASRLAAMQAAERKIGDLMDELQLEFNQARQNSIDEELFDVITGYEALSHTG
ncbi:MAG TPA: F0F1 ATP synthase subunit gamma [Bryobacteraceae bacterium]|jgi:F-type H+-transporting ATPase subunit gamma